MGIFDLGKEYQKNKKKALQQIKESEEETSDEDEEETEDEDDDVDCWVEVYLNDGSAFTDHGKSQWDEDLVSVDETTVDLKDVDDRLIHQIPWSSILSLKYIRKDVE